MTVSDLVSGLLLGGFYALIALGLSLVFGVLRMVNLAHGELVIGGGYLAVALADAAGLSPLVSLPLVVVVVAAIAYAVQRLLLNPLLVAGANGPLVATFGLACSPRPCSSRRSPPTPARCAAHWPPPASSSAASGCALPTGWGSSSPPSSADWSTWS